MHAAARAGGGLGTTRSRQRWRGASEEEVQAVTDFLRSQGEPVYDESSHDGARTMSLVCEQAIGATGDADPMLGLFSGGRMVAGVVGGLAATSDEGCTWSLMPGIAPRQFVVDVTVQKDDPRSGVVVSSTSSDGGGLHTVLFETNDGAVSFRRIGSPLGEDFLALTVEVAPSAPKRVYVSGTVSGDGGASMTPTVARSNDRGTTFRRSTLGTFGAGYTAWISAVDPKDPSTLYVRVRSTEKDRLMVSSDGATTFREVYAAAGALTGFALSPDGDEVAVGGAADGIMLASTRDFAWKKASEVHAQCLTWTKAGLYACGIEWLDMFVVGLSKDHGKTFEALSLMSDPCPARCAAGSTVAQACTGELWRATQASIKQDAGACGGGDDDARAIVTPRVSTVDDAAPVSRAAMVAVVVVASLGLCAGVLALRRRRPDGSSRDQD